MLSSLASENKGLEFNFKGLRCYLPCPESAKFSEIRPFFAILSTGVQNMLRVRFDFNTDRVQHYYPPLLDKTKAMLNIELLSPFVRELKL